MHYVIKIMKKKIFYKFKIKNMLKYTFNYDIVEGYVCMFRMSRALLPCKPPYNVRICYAW